MSAEDILKLARAYAGASGLALTTVGRRACGNDKIFLRLEQGHGCNINSVSAAFLWFSRNWPVDLPWPDGISPRAVESEAA
jgi:hypothetical protein